VLDGGHVVAAWKIVTTGRRYDIEVTMLPGTARLADNRFVEPVAAVEAALGIVVAEVPVRAAIP